MRVRLRGGAALTAWTLLALGCRSVPKEQDAELLLSESVEPTATWTDPKVQAVAAAGRPLVTFSVPAPPGWTSGPDRSVRPTLGSYRLEIDGESVDGVRLGWEELPGTPPRLQLSFGPGDEWSTAKAAEQIDRVRLEGSVLVCSEPATFLLERWWEPRDKPQASEARGVTWAVRSWSAERLKLEFRGVHPGRVRVDLRGVNSAESWSDEPLEGEPGFLRRIHLFSGGLTEEAEIRVTVWQEVERYDFEFLAEGLRVE